MQNVVNFIVPFFGNDGKPIANGRVHFCKVDTSATTFNGISSPDYINVYDKDGNALPNPMLLNDCGRFGDGLQPFVDDGIEYKMIVDRPTGIPAQYDDDDPCWETELVIRSKNQSFHIDVDGIPVIGTIDELRHLDPDVKNVIVLGYNTYDDSCPSRLFSYENTPFLGEDNGTRIKSSVEGVNGTWVFQPETDVIDVRWFGILGGDMTDSLSALTNILYNYHNIYFPIGAYYFSSSFSVNRLVLGYGARILPFPPARKDIFIDIGVLDNMGGYFGGVSFGGNNYVATPQAVVEINRNYLKTPSIKLGEKGLLESAGNTLSMSVGDENVLDFLRKQVGGNMQNVLKFPDFSETKHLTSNFLRLVAREYPSYISEPAAINNPILTDLQDAIEGEIVLVKCATGGMYQFYLGFENGVPKYMRVTSTNEPYKLFVLARKSYKEGNVTHADVWHAL